MPSDHGRDWASVFRGAIALFALGMTGVLALAVYSVPSLRAIPELEALSFPLLVVLAAANSTIILAVFVLLGAMTAPRIGLHSHVYTWAAGHDTDWNRLRDSVPVAVALGTALFVIVALLDAAFSTVVQIDVGAVDPGSASLRALAGSIPMRLLYGGIAEELLLRWGLMAPVAWAIWRVRGRGRDGTESPSAGTIWVAIVVSAVLFGVGHLPALSQTLGLTTALVVRTVLLNALVGIGLGWLFWRRSLEAAMVAHAAFHVALVAVSTGMILFL